MMLFIVNGKQLIASSKHLSVCAGVLTIGTIETSESAQSRYQRVLLWGRLVVGESLVMGLERQK